MEKVQFIPEGEDRPVDFYVVEEATLGGRQYLLVTDSEDGDAEALILRACTPEGSAAARPAGGISEGFPESRAGSADPSDKDSEETAYEIVEDEKELSAVLLLMRDGLEELGIEVEE